MRRAPREAWTLGCFALLSACAHRGLRPDLGAIYDRPAQQIGVARTPVVVLPGALGSKLENALR